MTPESADYGNDNTVSISRIGDDQLVVSTVKLPSESGNASYETMVFPQGSYIDIDAERYATLQEDQIGHEEMTSKWQDAKSVYCFDCGNDWANRSWLLADGHTYCPTQRNGSHKVCSECLSAYHCEEHPNWCIECQPDEPCETHREGEL